MTSSLKVKDGDVIDFYGITWNDGWEFGAPGIILSPIIQIGYNSLEETFEELLIDLCTQEIFSEEPEEDWRGWNIDLFKDFAISVFGEETKEVPGYFKEIKEDLIVLNASVKFTYVEEEDWYDFEVLEETYKHITFTEKVCNLPSTGCDLNCMECEVPTYEPEWCEECAESAEESGIDYEPNFTHKNGCWTCETCGGGV